MQRLSSARGFTLVEALVVIAVIGIVIAVAAPAYLGQREKGWDQDAVQHLEQAYRVARNQTIDAAGVFGVSGQTDAAALVAAINLAVPEQQAQATASAPSSFDDVQGRVNVSVAVSSQATPSLSLRARSKSGKVCRLTGPGGVAAPTVECVEVEQVATPPTMNGAPSISGVPQVGNTLTVDDGSWTGDAPITFSRQWQRSPDGSSWSNITGATGSQYTLVNADYDQQIRVQVTAVNDADSVTQTTQVVGPVTALAPQNTSLPAVSGTAKAGQTLTVSSGAWTGTAPLSYSYQWQRQQSYSDVVKADSPLAYWRLDETGNAASAADASGNSRTGTYQQTGYGASLGWPAATATQGTSLRTHPWVIRWWCRDSSSYTTVNTALTPSATDYASFVSRTNRDPGCADYYNMQADGEVVAPSTGTYYFHTYSDDGVRLWVNGTLVLDNWTHHSPTWNTSSAVNLTAGQRVTLLLQFFEGSGGSEIILDWSGPSLAQQRAPAASSALAYMSASSTSYLPTGRNPVTLEAWFNASSMPAWRPTIIGYGSSTANDLKSLTVSICNCSPRRLQIRINGADSTTGTTTINTGTWYHVAVTDNGTDLRLYLNGNLEITYNPGGSFSKSAANLWLGRWWVSGEPEPFHGQIDEAAVYGAALTQAQLQTHYSQAASTFYTDISGATGSSYSLTTSDVDSSLRAVVTATNVVGPASATSNVVGPVVDYDSLAQVLADSPSAYYRLNDTSGTTMLDARNSYHGTYQNSPTKNMTPAISGTAVTFNGSTQHATFPRVSLSSGLALEAWIKTTSTDSTVGQTGHAAQPIFGDTLGGGYVSFGLTAGKLSYNAYTSDNGYRNVTGVTQVNDGKWHHVAVRHTTSGGVYLYIDGVQDASGTITTYNTANAGVALLGRGNSGADNFDGTIDEAVIYNGSLTAARILAHYNDGHASGGLVKAYGATVMADSPVIFLRHDENADANFSFDASSNGNGGVYNNTASSRPTLRQSGALADPALKSATYNGSSNYHTVAPVSALNSLGAQGSVEGWFRPTDAARDDQSLVIKGDCDSCNSTLSYGLDLDQVAGGNQFRLWVDSDGAWGPSVSIGSGAVTMNQWHHVVGVWSSAGTAIYVDGVLRGYTSSYVSARNASGYLRVGGGVSGWNYYAGGLDEIAVYPTALSCGTTTVGQACSASSAIFKHYSAGLDPSTPPQNLSVPTLSGSTTVGSTLTTTTGTWSGGGLSFNYQWQRNSGSGWIDVSGATATTYTLQAGDVGYQFRSKVTATNLGGSQAAYSTATSTVTQPPPQATTNTASSIGQTTATLNGTVTANGWAVEYRFEWGTSTSYGNATAWTSTSGGAVSAGISGLSSGTTYHYRLVVRKTSDQSTYPGSNVSFQSAVPSASISIWLGSYDNNGSPCGTMSSGQSCMSWSVSISGSYTSVSCYSNVHGWVGLGRGWAIDGPGLPTYWDFSCTTQYNGVNNGSGSNSIFIYKA